VAEKPATWARRLGQHGAVANYLRTGRPAAAEGKPTAERTVLFLFSDTGAGHRRAAEALIEALAVRYPGAIHAVMCDPLRGPAAARPQRWLAGLYGPCVRWAPWAWGAAYYVSDSRPAMALLWRSAFAFARRPAVAAAAATRPDVIVSCHPLTGRAAMQAAARPAPAGPVPVLTVVTDLAAMHTSWRYPSPDLVAVPSARAGCRTAGDAAWVPTGLPVETRAQTGRLQPATRAALRRSLGLGERDFVVLLTGGGEGCGGLARRTAAIVRQFSDVHVVAACGRNSRLRGRLTTLTGRAAGRLTVLGFTRDFTDWLHCADVVVTKAGPGIIAEAACCGTPMLLTSHLPGQERGNTGLVARAGAGRRARGVRGVLRELALLRGDPAALAAMQAGCQRLARPDASGEVAALIATLAGLPVPLAGLPLAPPADPPAGPVASHQQVAAR
jgi:1,2-diacylglycerol 3-beta-galactosyltransferase